MPYEPNFSTTGGSLSGEEHLARCKQCGAPVTMMNVTKGPTGVFCSAVCKEKHEQFVRAAAATERRERPAGGLLFARLRRFAGAAVFLAVVLIAIGFGARFAGVRVPVASPLFDWAWSWAARLAG